VVICVLGLAALALFNTFFIKDLPRLELLGAMKNSNDLAAVFIFILPFVLRSLGRPKNPDLKALQLLRLPGLLIVTATILLGVWKAQSRAAYLAIFCMGIIWMVYQVRHQKALLVGGLIVAFVGIGVLSGLQLGRDSSDLEGSRQNRLGYWQAGLAMAIRNPVLGVGYGRFPFSYKNYGAASFTEYGRRTAHSSWILLVSEAGIPALVIFLGLFALAFQRAWRLAGVAPELLLSLTGYGVAMSFLSHVYTIYPYLLLALIFSYPKKDVLA
jgi:O-antigen ligase